jgi:hypothetical protein
LTFRYNWNQEVIAKFYATLFFDKKERIFMWMTNGRRFNIKISQFTEILGLSSHLDIRKKLHTGRGMAPRERTQLYIPNSGFRAPNVEGILPHFLVLQRMMRRTLAPRIGDSNVILAYERNLLDALMKHERFDVFRLDHGSLEEEDIAAPSVSSLMRPTRCDPFPYNLG